MKITLYDIRQMVMECVGKIMENTNMKTLYHFTSLSRFREIVKTDKLRSSNYLNDYWDNNSHISLTRHKSNLEGFASVHKNTVRIEFNMDRLNSLHDIIRVKPMEFYSPNRQGAYMFANGEGPYTTSKTFYQNQFNKNDLINIEYHNQAEEGVQIYTSAINKLHKYVNRVDVFFGDFYEACSDYDKWIVILSWFDEINDSRFANFVPIFVYSDSKHFVLQDNHCMKLSDMVEYFEKNVCNIKYESGKRLEKFLGDISQLEEGVDEISKQTFQNAAGKAYRRGKWGEPDSRVKKFRQAAVDKHRDEHSGIGYGNYNYSEEEQEKYITDNNGNKIIIFDSDYTSLMDLYNGVRQGRLLIHCRAVDEDNVPDRLYPEFGETVQDAYGCEFPEDMEKPELLFASDNFNWAGNYPKNGSVYTEKRNGIFFVYGDNFEKSIGDGYVQTIDGQIYLNDDVPITVETDDWFSEEPADVAGVMIIK